MLEPIWPKALGLADPELADEFIWRKTLERLEAAAGVVSGHEVTKMPLELGLIVVVTVNGILGGSIHLRDLSIDPRMHRLG